MRCLLDLKVGILSGHKWMSSPRESINRGKRRGLGRSHVKRSRKYGDEHRKETEDTVSESNYEETKRICSP